MTVAKATSVEYYTSGGGVAAGMESYYTDAVTEGEPPGIWLGAGAAELGLTGEVDAEMMHVLYGEFVNPLTGEAFGTRPAQRRTVEERIAAKLAAEPGASPERVEQIRAQTRDRANVIGWDATFAVPKSVTVVHTAAQRGELAATQAGDTERAQAFRFMRVQIEDAIAEANQAGISALEQRATARSASGSGGAMRWVQAPNLVVASFFQHTNRSIDPHLHVHNVILNRARCDDGEVRALDGQDLLAQRYEFSAVADRTLTEGLHRRLGLAMRDRPDGAGREVALVPQRVIEHFSTRRQQMNAALTPLVDAFTEQYGREPTELEKSRLKTTASRSSRAAKSHDGEWAAEMNDRWLVQLATETGLSLDTIGDEMLAEVIPHLTGTTPVRPVDAEGLSAWSQDWDVVALDAAGKEWSPRAVIAEAVATCEARSATWGRSNLINELELHLPVLGLPADQIPVLLNVLADEALSGPEVVQVAGMDTGDYAAPSASLYAATGTLAAEGALRRAALQHAGLSLPADLTGAWLDEHCPSIGADQRAAVEGIASSDAAITVLLGPAGTGKSFAAGALAGAWSDLTDGQGRVVGLAVSNAATKVLHDDGVSASRNVSQWLAHQDKLAAGSTHPGDTQWRLRPSDVVMIDEASMVSTADLTRIRERVESAGARMVLTGDPRQLAAVEAGGAMGLLDGHAETYALSDVRRFTADWERTASLALRDGESEALAEYDRHGRIMSHPSTQTATEAAARAAVADRVDGRSVVVVTATNAQAGAVAAQVRDQLISLGLVQAEGGVITGRDGNTASVGDVITCRRNEHTLGVTNRVQYQVLDTGQTTPSTPENGPQSPDSDTTGTDDGGWLLVQEIPAPGRTAGPPVRLPAAYVAHDVQLGYAATVHSAQGLTVDAGHLVAGGEGGMDAAGLYVAMTRGRGRNTTHVALDTGPADESAPVATTQKGGEVRFADDTTRSSGRAVLENALSTGPDTTGHLPQRPGDGVAATVAAEQAARREASMDTITARLEAETRRICRSRTDRHLDDLVHDGILDEHTRARLSADAGTEQLSRLLRSVEQAGHDPKTVLTDAITAPRANGRGLDDAQSVAQVLSHRITAGRPALQPAEPPTLGHQMPADIPDQDAQRLAHLHERAHDRTTALGQEMAEQAPEWAVLALGPVPDESDTADRADWQQRAGTVAAHREAVGWEHPTQGLDRMPGLATTERRGSFAAAWDALGRPEPRLEEADMSDGQLLARITAWEREQEWAPPHVDTHLQRAETEAEAARQNAALTDAEAEAAEHAGQHEHAQHLRETAAEHRAEAEFKAAAARSFTELAQTRGAWAEHTVGTRDAAERAQPEAERRGLARGREDDRTTAQDWLHDHSTPPEADLIAAEDEHRPITETDVADYTPDDAAWVATTPTVQDDVDVLTIDPRTDHEDAASTRAVLPPVLATPEPSLAELEMMTAATAFVHARLQDRAAQESAHQVDTQEAAQTESFEAGRRRRDAAEFDHVAVTKAAALSAELDDTYDAGLGNV